MNAPCEKTPLLTSAGRQSQGSYRSDFMQSNSMCEILGIFAILLIFISGFMIGTYLLAKDENLLLSDGMILDMVEHDIWSNKRVLALPILVKDYHFLYIVILQAGNESCYNVINCVRILRNLQVKQANRDEIPYNFLIGGDEQTYEIRGFNESGFNFLPPQNLFAIGFIGNYTNSAPSDKQLKSALSLINELKNRKKLHKSYQIFGIRNLSVSSDDGEAIFNRITNWNNFATVLNVL